ncbi:MAG: ABC transporter permease, partial [Oscillospiraceae bacterium]
MLKKLKPYTLLIIINIIFIIIAVFADLNLPSSLARIINIGVYGQDKQYIITTGMFMLLIAMVSVICNIVSGFLAARISTDFAKNLRGEVFRKVETFSLYEMDQFGASSLITRTTNDITQIQTFIQMMLKLLIMTPFMAVGGIIMAYSKSPRLSSVIAISMPILIIAILIIAKYVIPLSAIIPEKLDRVNLVLREKLTGIRVIRAFNTQKHENEKFEIANTDLAKTVIKMQRITATLLPVATLILYLTSVAITWSGAKLVDVGQIQVGDIVAVLQYIMQIMLAFMMMTMIFVMLPRARASMIRVNEVINTQVSIKDENKEHKLTDLTGYIEFKDVSLTFHGADEPTIKNISFFAKPGQTT